MLGYENKKKYKTLCMVAAGSGIIFKLFLNYLKELHLYFKLFKQSVQIKKTKQNVIFYIVIDLKKTFFLENN